MKRNRFLLFSIMVLLIALSTSCVTYKDVRYLQDMPIEGLPITENLEATIAPYDELRIYVLSNSGKDDELLKPFNALKNVSQGTGVGMQLGYLVDVEGYIEFPVLGKLHVGGLTRMQIQDTIASHLQKKGYIKNPLVVARFLNFKVYMLTSSGGKVLNIANERCTFLEALAMAGGMDWYTRRDRIGVMREVDGKRVVHYLDPRSTAVFDDDFFLLQQNDIIFTEERSWKFFTNNMSAILAPISILTSTLAVYTLVETFIKNHQ